MCDNKNVKNSYILYIHTLKSDGRKYIGITCNSPAKRWHKGLGYKKQPFFWNAIEKYGWNNFNHEVVLTDLTKEEAIIKETEYIAKYKTTNKKYGFNLTKGGEGLIGYKPTEETRRKMRENSKLKYNRINPNYWKGKHLSLETRNKISKKLKGVPLPTEQANKARIAKIDKGKSIIQYDLIMNKINEYKTIIQAERVTGVSNSHISQVCKGKRKTAGGYIWRYVKGDNNDLLLRSTEL